MIKKTKNRKKSILVLIVLFGSAIFVFNDIGIFKWIQLKKERYNLQAEIDLLILKEKDLLDELFKIENDSNYIKKIARERFHMVKPGEKIFRVIDRKKVASKKN